MKEKIYYSPIEKCFYSSNIHNISAISKDLIEITKKNHQDLLDGQSSGMIISQDDKGFPILVEKKLTQQELDAQKEAKHVSFLSSEMNRASNVIEILDDAIEFEIATDEEIKQHKELRKYRIELKRVKEQETWPLDPVWPICPEFFKPKE